MKKTLFSSSLVFILLSCNSNNTSNNELLAQKYKIEPASKTVKEAPIEDLKSNPNNPTNAIIDTFGLYKSPVKIIYSRILRQGDICELRIKFKNISDKSVGGVKFTWFCLTGFNKAATMDGIPDMGYGKGITDQDLKPNATVLKTWEIQSDDAKSILIARPTEVAFKNGSNWIIKPE